MPQYRIKKRHLTKHGEEYVAVKLTSALSDREIVSVCIDRMSQTIVRCHNTIESLRSVLKSTMDDLVTKVHLSIIHPVIFGGPGVYRDQLMEQMLRDAFVVYDFDGCSSCQAATASAVSHASSINAVVTQKKDHPPCDPLSSAARGVRPCGKIS